MAQEQIRRGSTELLVLGLLNEKPLHGYGLRKLISTRSHKRLEARDSMLYPALSSLEDRRLVEGQWEGPPEGKQKKVYHITREGEVYCAQLFIEWIQFMEDLGKVLPGLSTAQQFLAEGGEKA